MTDSCPACLARGIAPAASRHRGDSVVHGYRCPSCGHAWATSRLLAAYPRHLHPVPAQPHHPANPDRRAA